MGRSVGTVATLTRFPVKSMQGEPVDEVALTSAGLVGDRAYALVETETGKVLSAKSPGVGTRLLSCRAEFVEAPRPGSEMPPARVSFPDGAVVTTDVRNADGALSNFLQRQVTVQRAAPDDFTIEHDAPDIEGPVLDGQRDTVARSKLGAANGSFVDAFPVSVLTTSTLTRLQAFRPESRFDARRFRMNVVVDTPELGLVEDGWIGCSLHIGDTVGLTVVLSDPRCVMTTLAQDDLPHDNGILQTLVRHHRVEVAGGLHPCAGVYAVVELTGAARVGDQVSLA